MSRAPEDIFWMQKAFALAQKAQKLGEVPVGAVLVHHEKLIAEGFNSPIALSDPSAHAEIQVIRAACQLLQNYRLGNMTLYVTLEPCAMCAGAIIQARIGRVVFATKDLRTGAAGSVFNVLQNPCLNHQVEVSEGVLEQECSQLLKTFFQEKRSQCST